ncbi:Zinc-responsive transcriptional regulator ZAP1 [Leucoagaricus sp. SymC.cos]|nr:Zinc-responsive transcriptional regulator ZAP1 [Leucoagaricus sp. SymC.cos]
MSSQPSFSLLPLHPYSHLRSSNPLESLSTRKMQYPSILTQQPLHWNPYYTKRSYLYTIPASECADCNTGCNESNCSNSNQLTSQCTDQCVVITCNDPEHNTLNCADGHSNCDLICDSVADCPDCPSLSTLLQCCDGNHPYRASQQATTFSQQQQNEKLTGWDTPFGVLCDCAHADRLERSRPPPNINPLSPATVASGFSSATTGSSHLYSPSIASCPQPASTVSYTPINSPFLPILQPQVHESQILPYGVPQNRQPQSAASSSSSMTPLTCMWGNCKAQFTSLAELVGHVNLTHLRIPADSDTISGCTFPCSAHVHARQIDDTTRLPCLWGNCTEFLQPEQLTGTSSTSAEDILISSLASHLFQDHLGLQHFNNGGIQNSYLDIERMLAEMVTSQPQAQDQDVRGSQLKDGSYADCGDATGHESVPGHKPMGDATAGQPSIQDINSFRTPSPRTTTTAISSPTTSATEVASGEGGHVCLWDSCGKTFETCDDLMSHMSAVHVGSGKPQYDCLWEGCTRNGDKGFSSKQKICRHLQSHTGYRPFQCPECLQNFSEAATLQQHIRRHTQEKPYKCDFPGCGKSFAITGALTIHKRIHNGQKPFKCTYCGRGFAESSNLSKHLRTHTGERPYICTEPGCDKAFARPDQLTRHQGVHRKKTSSTVVEV